MNLTSITSVRQYFIQPVRFGPDTCTTTDGFGGRPWPSHNKLSHEIADSHNGVSVISKIFMILINLLSRKPKINLKKKYKSKKNTK